MSLVNEYITHYDVEITRKGQGSINNDTGLWEDGIDNLFSVNMSIQPTTQKDRLLLPEAVRDTQFIKIYTESLLQITNDRKGFKGDSFTYNDEKYVIYSSADWNSGDYDLKFYKYFAIMTDKDGSYVR